MPNWLKRKVISHMRSQAVPASAGFASFGISVTLFLLFLELLLFLSIFLLFPSVWLAVLGDNFAIFNFQNIAILEDKSAVLAVNSLERSSIGVDVLAVVLGGGGGFGGGFVGGLGSRLGSSGSGVVRRSIGSLGGGIGILSCSISSLSVVFLLELEIGIEDLQGASGEQDHLNGEHV